MAQTNSYFIQDDAGLAVRLRMNEVLAALQSCNSGDAEPSDTQPGMLWYDTSGTAPVLRIRNATDEAWEEFLDGGTY
jgi:hypothetical protein